MRDHLARHHFETYVADDPNARLAAALRVHVGGCDRCGTRKRAMEASKARFLATHPPPDFARAISERAAAEEAAPKRSRPLWRSPMLLVPLAIAIAAGVAAAFWFAQSPELAEERPSAGVALLVIARHGNQTRPLRDGDALAAGDQLAFEYALVRPQHALLLSIDDAGGIKRYFPAEGATESLLAPTARAQLPVGVEVDAGKGEERLYAFFSDTELDEAAARAELVRALAATRAIRGGGIPTLDEVDLPAEKVSVWFRKP